MNAIRIPLSVAVLLAVALASSAKAQTIYVDTSNDVVDFGGAQRVADLPGPDGKISLAEAGLASDNTPGVQTIGFHIPPNDWQYQQFFPGRAVLRPFLGFRVFDTVVLDATTQTAFSGDTNPNGGEVVIWAESYLNDNVGSLVVGFDSSSFHLSGGSHNTIQGNTLTPIEVFDSADNLIGGASPGQGNTGAVIQIDRASDNVVVGNTCMRVRVLGWIGGGQPARNNRIGGPSLGERNHITGIGTMNSEGIPSGYAVQLFDSIGTTVENDWIGLSPDGLGSGDPYNTIGIWFYGENHDTTVRGNRIAGVLAIAAPPHGGSFEVGSALVFSGTGSHVAIVGNRIGFDANDQPVLGSVEGISTYNYYLGPIQGLTIGGSSPGEGNEIAGQHATAIRVANTYADLRISGNSIHDNGALGIDLITDLLGGGVTPNDPLDADTGGNGLQNFPVLQSAADLGGSVEIAGTLSSNPSSSFTIEFFASGSCDPSGFGEGRTFLGSTSVATNAAGDAPFDVVLAASVPAGSAVTATATLEPVGATSEFSACVTAGTGPGTSACFGDGTSGPCPCGNAGGPGRGCQNSVSTGGARLFGSGVASLAADSLHLASQGELPSAFSIFLQGTAATAPVPFGDGLRCTGGTLKRLYARNASGGVVGAPLAGDPSISARSAALGDTIPAGGTRSYQVYYRDPSASFCPEPTGGRFNVSNAFLVQWLP